MAHKVTTGASRSLKSKYSSVAYSEELSEANGVLNLQSESSLAFKVRSQILQTPVKRLETVAVLERAKLRLRGPLAFIFQHQDIVKYGTSSPLLRIRAEFKQELGTFSGLQPFEEPKKTVVSSLGTLFSPDSKFKQGWNVLILFLLLYVFIFTPWVIAFEEVETGSPLFFVELFVDFLFFCDILVTMNSAYYDRDSLVVSRKQIFVNYFTGMLVVDVVAIFPFWLFEGLSKSNSLIRIIRITKVARVFRASKLMKVVKHLASSEWMERVQKLMKSYEGATRLVTAGYIIAIMAHFTACMWYFTAKVDGLGPDTWVVRFGFADASKGRLYLASLYWAFTILTTVGYGDIYAYTVSEMILCILWMLFGIGFYSFLVGTITSVLSSMDARNSQLQAKLSEIDRFTEEFAINEDLHKEMKKEASQKRAETDYLVAAKRMSLLLTLSRELRYRVCMSMYSDAASKVEFFQQQDIVFVNNIVPYLNYEVFSPLSMVYNKGDHPDGVYFLVSGRVHFVVGPKHTVFKTMVTGSYFGEVELFERSLRFYTAVTEQECEVLIMNKSLFDKMLERYPKVARRLEDVVEQRKLRNAQAMSEVLDLLEDLYIKQDTTVEQLAGTKPRRMRSEFLTFPSLSRGPSRSPDASPVSRTDVRAFSMIRPPGFNLQDNLHYIRGSLNQLSESVNRVLKLEEQALSLPIADH